MTSRYAVFAKPERSKSRRFASPSEVLAANLAEANAAKVEAAREEGLELGRQQAASVYPLAHDEGFREGWAACRNAVCNKLRSRAMEDPTLKTLLIELINGEV